MINNNKIKFTNSFGMILEEGLVLTEFNSKIIIEYETIKRIQLLKKKKDVINTPIFFISLIAFVVSIVMYIRSDFLWHYLVVLFLSMGVILLPFLYTKYEYIFIISDNKNKNKIKFQVEPNYKEDAKTLINKVIDILEIKKRESKF